MSKLSVVLIFSFFSTVYIASAQQKANMALPSVLVYKTKKDYRDKVPVILSADRKTVVSYPAPADLKTGGTYAMPVVLHKGFLIDRRGIGWHSAFIKLTYVEYSKLNAAPTADQLYKLIIDKDPITTLYDCGRREPMKSLVHRLNKAIDDGSFKRTCKPVKEDAGQ